MELEGKSKNQVIEDIFIVNKRWTRKELTEITRMTDKQVYKAISSLRNRKKNPIEIFSIRIDRFAHYFDRIYERFDEKTAKWKGKEVIKLRTKVIKTIIETTILPVGINVVKNIPFLKDQYGIVLDAYIPKIEDKSEEKKPFSERLSNGVNKLIGRD